jgi:hypothetical protein
MQCVIQWIDETGMPTPDENPAVALVVRESFTDTDASGHTITYSESEPLPICQEHLKRLPIPHWSIIPLHGFI